MLKLGLDVHYRQVTVAMQEDDGRIRVAGKMSHQAFAGWIRKKVAEGWSIYSCYEAGASGYWLHRELETLGVKNLVVAPKAMGQEGKRQKTDRRDSAQLLDDLERYERGQHRALDVGRYRSRGKGLLCAQGIQVDCKWWKAKGWISLSTDPRCQDWIRGQLEAWRQKILSTDQEQAG